MGRFLSVHCVVVRGDGILRQVSVGLSEATAFGVWKLKEARKQWEEATTIFQRLGARKDVERLSRIIRGA